MNDILTQKLNDYLTGFIEYKWEEFTANVELTQLSEDQLNIIKTVFHLGYQQGYEDNYQELKEMYKRDRILLVDAFEEE